MTTVDLLVVGGSGFVGSRLVDTAVKAGLDVAYTYASHPLELQAASFQLKIQEGRALEECIAMTQPRCIVYCAVPAPGSEDALYEVISVQGVQRICASLRNFKNCKLIYVSTNAVFSGQAGPYKESDIPDPEQRHGQYRVYAITRAQGEQVALSSWHNSIVARTSDVNGRDLTGKFNLRISALLDRLHSGETSERSTRAIISPTLVDNLAHGLLEISREEFTDRGILHLAGSQQISYYDFACQVADNVQADKTLIRPESSQVRNISLDTGFTQRLLRTKLLDVEQQLSVLFP